MKLFMENPLKNYTNFSASNFINLPHFNIMFPHIYTDGETKMLLWPMWQQRDLHTFISNETHFAVTHDTQPPLPQSSDHPESTQPPTILADPGQTGFPALLQLSGYTQTQWEPQPQNLVDMEMETRRPEINFTTDTLTIFSTAAAGRH